MASTAVRDLRLDEDGLSLYRVTDESDARLIAAVYVLVLTEESGPYDWILMPDQSVDEFDLQPDPDSSLPGPLRGRHHLLKGLDESGALRLAAAACGDSNLRSFRQNIADIRKLARAVTEAFGLGSADYTDYWRERLASPGGG